MVRLLAVDTELSDQDLPESRLAVSQTTFAEKLVANFGGLFDNKTKDLEQEWCLRFIILAAEFFDFNRCQSISQQDARDVLLLVMSEDLAVKHAATIFSYQFIFWNNGPTLPDDCPRFIGSKISFRIAFKEMAKENLEFIREYYRTSLLSPYSLFSSEGESIPHRHALLSNVHSEVLRGWVEESEQSKLWYQCFVVMVLYGIAEEDEITHFLELKTESQMVRFLSNHYFWLLCGDFVGLVLDESEYRWHSPIGPAGLFHVGYLVGQRKYFQPLFALDVFRGRFAGILSFQLHRPLGVPWNELDPSYLCTTQFSRGISGAWWESQSFHLFLIRISSGLSDSAGANQVEELKRFYQGKQ
jgi:hypothetical protein